MLPAEAIAASALLWHYYLIHVVVITVIMWLMYAFFANLGEALFGSLVMLLVVFLVEIVQNIYPVLGDASLDDIIVGVTTVLVCTMMFGTIRYRRD